MKHVFPFALGIIAGVGLAAVALPISRSILARDWNTSAIEARFDKITGDDKGIDFWYVVRNNTSLDYTLDDEMPHKLLLYSRQRLLIAVPQEFRRLIDIELPIYVPAKREVRYELIRFNASVNARNNEDPEIWAGEKLKPLDGFSIFDQNKHYEILLRRGN